MCNLEEPRSSGGGPALCDAAKTLIITCILEGEANAQIRAALKKTGHVHDLSNNAFSAYRNHEVVVKARQTALLNVKDMGIVSLARRIEALNDQAEDLFALCKKSKDAKEKATLARSAVLTVRELSRIVDLIDPTGTDGIPNAGEAKQDAPPEITIEQVLRVMRTMSAQKRRIVQPQASEPESVSASI